MITKNTDTAERGYIVLIAGVFILANSLHVIAQWLSNPPDRMFTGIAHHVTDYFLYVDVIAQGATGHLASFPHFTSELLPATYYHWFYTVVGWLGHLIGFSPFAIYNVALIILMVLLCILWYVLVKLIFPTNTITRFTAFAFILSASNFVNLKGFISAGRLDLIGYLWLSPSPAFNRLGGVPHQVLQTMAFILLLIVCSQCISKVSGAHSFFQQKNRFWLAGLTGLAFWASTANPIQMLLFIAAAGLCTVWQIWKVFNHPLHVKHHITQLVPMTVPLVILTCSAIPGLSLAYIWFLHPVFAAAKMWEAEWIQLVPFWNMILSIGPVMLFVPFGVIPFFKNSTPLRILVFLYGIGSFILFYTPLYKMIGSANPRWLSPAAHAIWAILAAQGVWSLSQFLSKFPGKISNFKYQISNIFVIWHLTFVIIYLLFTLPALYSQIDARANPQIDTILTSDLNHVPKQVVDALTWLRLQPEVQSSLTLRVKQVRTSSSVVLTDPALPYDILVPVFTGKISFAGHPLHTLHPEEKEVLRQRFFNGEMSVAEAKKFITDHRIGWIIIQSQNSRFYNYTLCKKAYQNEILTIMHTSI